MKQQSWFVPILFLIMEAVAQSSSTSSTLKTFSRHTRCAANWTLDREAILSLRTVVPKIDQRTRLIIASLECARQRRGQRGGQPRRERHRRKTRDVNSISCLHRIPVLIGRRQNNSTVHVIKDKEREVTLQRVPTCQNLTRPSDKIMQPNTPRACIVAPPTLYVLNAAALTKPNAIDHLAADMRGYHIDVCIITETHLKQKHASHVFDIEGYNMYRRDRTKRRGGGVAIYVNSHLCSSLWKSPSEQLNFELLWIRVQSDKFDAIIGAIYHPPKPIYPVTDLLCYIESCLEIIARDEPKALVI